MAISCTGALTADILFDCANVAVAGIEQNVVLINKNDIDYTATTFSPTKATLITNLVLKSGKVGFKITGVKQSNGKASEAVIKENTVNKVKHTFSGVVFNPTSDNKEQLMQFINGGKYVAVVEQIWKGEDNESAFEVLGIRSGLELATMTNNSKENDNMIMFELSSTDGYEEPAMPANLLMTDYGTTKTAFDNKFIAN